MTPPLHYLPRSSSDPVAESKLRAIFDNCFQFIALLDEEGRLLEINRSSLAVAGVERDQVIGEYFWDTFFWVNIIEAKFREEFIHSWPRICRGEFVRFEVEGRLPNGEARTVDFSANPVLDERSGNIRFVVAEARDITQYKNLERELVEKNRQLAQINSDLENFAVLASHDLRQPLQSVSMNATILSKMIRQEAPECKAQLKHIKDGVKRMNLLLESILDYARSTKSSHAKTRVDCSEMIPEVLESLASTISESNVKLTVSALPTVMGNKLQLIRVFQNLLSNAIKFRDEKRSLEISVSATRDGDSWIFRVCDNGMGISEKDMPLLFKRFSRLPSYEHLTGLGAGLSICKDIIEDHGGKIWVESQPGVGSTFAFTLKEPNL